MHNKSITRDEASEHKNLLRDDMSLYREMGISCERKWCVRHGAKRANGPKIKSINYNHVDMNTFLFFTVAQKECCNREDWNTVE